MIDLKIQHDVQYLKGYTFWRNCIFYLMAPCTRGFLKNRENNAVTSSRSEARSANASTLVRHLTVLVENKRNPGNRIFPPSASKSQYQRYVLAWFGNLHPVTVWDEKTFALLACDIWLNRSLQELNWIVQFRSLSSRAFLEKEVLEFT